jgi:hypothetical protein
MPTPVTPGEQLFVQYLDSIGVPYHFEQKYADKSKMIDFRIEWNGKPHFFDVKDFQSPPRRRVRSLSTLQPYKPIRERIVRCRKKFKEYKAFCCAPVFYNDGALAMLEYNHVMLGSMYGDSGFRIPVDVETGTADPSRIERAYLGGGMMVGPGGKPENTTISALITLTTVRPDHDLTSIVPRVIVWHNAFARIPFPADLFCGPYDTHVGLLPLEDGGIGQDVTFRGDMLPSRARF